MLSSILNNHQWYTDIWLSSCMGHTQIAVWQRRTGVSECKAYLLDNERIQPVVTCCYMTNLYVPSEKISTKYQWSKSKVTSTSIPVTISLDRLYDGDKIRDRVTSIVTSASNPTIWCWRGAGTDTSYSFWIQMYYSPHNLLTVTFFTMPRAA